MREVREEEEEEEASCRQHRCQGDGQCELYQFLTSKDTNPKFAGDIKWNFEKFLVDRDGKVVARFAPRVKPDSEEVLSAIKQELDKQ